MAGRAAVASIGCLSLNAVALFPVDDLHLLGERSKVDLAGRWSLEFQGNFAVLLVAMAGEKPDEVGPQVELAFPDIT